MDLREKKTYGYRERDELKRVAFLLQLAQLEAWQRIYLDEAGMDARDDYGYGWCAAGKRFEALKSGRRDRRINVIAAYCERQLLAPFTVEGTCNRVVFECWLETCLVPQLQPNQVVILDHAPFIMAGGLQKLLKQQVVACSTCRPILQISIALRSVGLGSKVAFAGSYRS